MHSSPAIRVQGSRLPIVLLVLIVGPKRIRKKDLNDPRIELTSRGGNTMTRASISGWKDFRGYPYRVNIIHFMERTLLTTKVVILEPRLNAMWLNT